MIYKTDKVQISIEEVELNPPFYAVRDKHTGEVLGRFFVRTPTDAESVYEEAKAFADNYDKVDKNDAVISDKDNWKAATAAMYVLAETVTVKETK